MEILLQQPAEQAVSKTLEYQMHGESWRVVDPYSHECKEGKSISMVFNGALYGSIFLSIYSADNDAASDIDIV